VAYYSVFPYDDLNNPIAFNEYDHATHFVYDIHGNVTKLMQDNRKMSEDFISLADHRIKTMEYSYDLVSGNVHRMSVQTGEADQWHHAYMYDADNRITEVRTSTQTPIIDISMPAQFLDNELTENTDWTLEAKYFYYAHGPLARTELGNQLQGLDYIYNLQGWLKGVNATSLDNALDPGGDGTGLFSKDVMAFSLHYYDGDYTPIGGVALNPACSIAYSSAAVIHLYDDPLNPNDDEVNLYNGNIRFMQTTLTDIPTRDALPMLNAYKYDQLNRLLEARSYTDGLSSNTWNPTTYDDKYFNAFTYDANGNILTQKRRNSAGTMLDDLTYHYQVDGFGNLMRNRLYNVNDVAGFQNAGDLTNQGTFNSAANQINISNNYVYDEEGRLIKDVAEGIELIVWRVDGKVKEIHRHEDFEEMKHLTFDYDAFGRRIAKHVYNNLWVLERSNYYILDAQGNQLAVYEHVPESETPYELTERVIYGSARIGANVQKVDLLNDEPEELLSLTLGEKHYFMSNHLGNILTVINDIKVPYLVGTDVAYYSTIVSTADYSPFGVQLDVRTTENQSKWGFQGQETDNEIKGEGNSVNYTYRMHDARLGRFFSRDPLASKYPMYSPYHFSSNQPIHSNELEGLESSNDLNQQSNPYIYPGANIGGVGKCVADCHLAATIHPNVATGAATTAAVVLVVAVDVFITKGWLSRAMFIAALGENMNATDNYNKAKASGNNERAAEYKAQMEATGPIVALGVAAEIVAPLVVTAAMPLAQKIATRSELVSKWMTAEQASFVDLTLPVYTKTIPKNTELVQYRVMGQEGTIGNFYAPVGTTPAQIGIDPTKVVEVLTVTVTKETKVLVSTHIKNAPYYASPPGATTTLEGGGTQIFSRELKNNISVQPAN
jgi:RHS repeat-associated protein